MSAQPEVWLRGPLPDILPQLQPPAHALLQAKEEVQLIMKDFPGELLWERPASVASVAFHLQHLTGVLDRLFTYAGGNLLTESQHVYLKAEGRESPNTDAEQLVNAFLQKVDESIENLKGMRTETLYEFRGVGRARLPSTTIGLIFHAAEHTMRHVGQLLVTAKILKADAASS